jgi:hypothetical protein
MNEYREYIEGDTVTEPHAELNLPRHIVELARLIATECKGHGNYVVQLGVSPHPREPMRVEIAKRETIKHWAIEK